MSPSQPPEYEVAVVGGGPAGLTTALYTTRLGHQTAVFDDRGGRHTAVRNVHNLYGVSESVSGRQLSEHAVRQFREYGGDFYPDAVAEIEPLDGDDTRFRIEAAHATVTADRVVLATGFTDRGPGVPDLRQFTGRGLHYCLHCDAYVLGDGSVFVLGHGEHAAEVAMVMLNFTDDVQLLLDGEAPAWSEETGDLLAAHPVERIDTEVVSAYPEAGDAEEPWLGGLEFADGTERDYLGGFAMYGTSYTTRLAEEVGCALEDDGAIAVGEEFETSVDGVYAVGDVTHGQNQTAVAVGDGARAGIALHKELRTFPLSAEELDGGSVSDSDANVPGVAADVRARMRRDRTVDGAAGLREPLLKPARPDRG